jgi:hypothetical protein
LVNKGLGIALIPDTERGAPGLDDSNLVSVLDSEVGRGFNVCLSVRRVLAEGVKLNAPRRARLRTGSRTPQPTS